MKNKLGLILIGLCLALTPALAATPNNAAGPISDAGTRVTKKPFGLKVSPKSSPIKPERFSGYHTGVDFETTTAEQKLNITIYAICDGRLLLKKYASGYGGVAVQSCVLNKQNVTVVYGHLRLSSITLKTGKAIKAGQPLGLLGAGYSQETDGERKHLHLGIHKGKAINLSGYVKTKKELSQWLDYLSLFK